jgi:hypothetical protein
MKGTEAMTPAERSRFHRERKKAEGYRLVQVHLEPRQATIVGHMEQSGMTISEAVNQLIDLAWKKHEV